MVELSTLVCTCPKSSNSCEMIRTTNVTETLPIPTPTCYEDTLRTILYKNHPYVNAANCLVIMILIAPVRAYTKLALSQNKISYILYQSTPRVHHHRHCHRLPYRQSHKGSSTPIVTPKIGSLLHSKHKQELVVVAKTPSPEVSMTWLLMSLRNRKQ